MVCTSLGSPSARASGAKKTASNVMGTATLSMAGCPLVYLSVVPGPALGAPRQRGGEAAGVLHLDGGAVDGRVPMDRRVYQRIRLFSPELGPVPAPPPPRS